MPILFSICLTTSDWRRQNYRKRTSPRRRRQHHQHQRRISRRHPRKLIRILQQWRSKRILRITTKRRTHPRKKTRKTRKTWKKTRQKLKTSPLKKKYWLRRRRGRNFRKKTSSRIRRWTPRRRKTPPRKKRSRKTRKKRKTWKITHGKRKSPRKQTPQMGTQKTPQKTRYFLHCRSCILSNFLSFHYQKMQKKMWQKKRKKILIKIRITQLIILITFLRSTCIPCST